MHISQEPAIITPSIVTFDGVRTAYNAPDSQHAGLVLPTGWQDRVPAILGNKKLTEIYTTLKGLSSNFISPADIQAALVSLSTATWKQITISDTEMSRMEWVFSRMQNPAEVAELVTKITENTEWNKPPLIVTFPEYILVDGVAKNFSVATLSELVPEKKWNHKKIWYNDSYVTAEQASEIFSGTLRVYTSAPLAWSKDKQYSDQLDLQKKLIGDDAKIGIDAYFAMIIHHWAHPSSDTLMLTDWMRLNTLGSARDPLDVSSGDSGVCLASDDRVAISRGGFGASSSLLSAS